MNVLKKSRIDFMKKGTVMKKNGTKKDLGFDKTVKLVHTIPTIAVATETLTLI